ncbi:dihydroorotase [Spirochaeta cellobiosiphila]|uniref:dihydroorotase n=1 Tax=Spirochaeta cellobiosiphila TaxID=504483 RepID=UPI000408F880|nr:dihydroorotase [Spirochaeta cellobiosiphila]
MAIDRITIRKPDDLHIHLRQGELLQDYAQDVGKWCKRVVPMPNTVPPVITANQMLDYKKVIEEASPGLVVVPVFKIDASLTFDDIKALKKSGAFMGKYYPQGATTNSKGGNTDWKSCFSVFEAMESEGLILSMHGEEPDDPVLLREERYLSRLDELLMNFPKLKVILEHVSTKAGIDKVLSLPSNFAGTITAHHLHYTLDDVIGGSLNSHLFCKPIIKSAEDRQAIRAAAFSGNPKFFYGSDSAPHQKRDKELKGAAGIYSALTAIPTVIEEFESANKLDCLENFLSTYGANFYNLELNQEKITFEKKTWTCPQEIHGVVPMRAGESISWNRAQ